MQVPTLETNISDVILGMKKFGKPILACAVGSDFTERVARNLESRNIPVFPTPERAVRAFAAMWRYKKYLQSV
jgi:acyl-CoA synthetase (NDP forming)